MFTAHTNQRAAIFHAFDHRLDLGTLRAEFFFHIKRDFHERAASARVLNHTNESLLF